MPDIRGIWVNKAMIDGTLATLRTMDDKTRKTWLRAAGGHGKPPGSADGLTVRGMIKAIIMAYVRDNGSLRDRPE